MINKIWSEGVLYIHSLQNICVQWAAPNCGLHLKYCTLHPQFLQIDDLILHLDAKCYITSLGDNGLTSVL